jgi:hypothetical protein
MTSQNVKEETLILPECKNQYETWYEYHAIWGRQEVYLINQNKQ